jgi:hypothetical protein
VTDNHGLLQHLTVIMKAIEAKKGAQQMTLNAC